MTSPHLITRNNQFRPDLASKALPIKTGLRIDTVLRQAGLAEGRGSNLKRRGAYVVLLNGRPMLQRTWCQRIQPGDLMSINILPLGGGSGGSNPLQIVLLAAVIAASIVTGGAAGVAYLGATGAAVASAAIMVGGTLLVNMMFPPKQAAVSAANTQTNTSPSPTYTISANQGNTSRLLQPIPVIYGRFRTFPDFASQPYVENSGNLQYLYQLFCITQGEIDIEQIRFDTADISTYPDITYEVIPPGGTVTLFPDNVITSAAVNNQVMLAPNQPGYEIQGPFPTNLAGTQINKIGIDLFYQGGVYSVDDQGNKGPLTVSYLFEYQEIDDSGVPSGDWQGLYTGADTLATDQPQLITLSFDVPLARYQVRGYRSSDFVDDGRHIDALTWAGMRGYLPSQANYGNLTLLAMITRASNTISGDISSKINIIGTRKLPVWDPVNGFSSENVATVNPAWAIMDALRNTDYGRGLPTSAFNIQALYTLSELWASRGDEFNGVFDTADTFWSALIDICAVGRAMPMYYAGLIDIIRNSPQTVPTAVFGPQNMQAASFQTRYLFPEVDSPDYIVMEYTDPVTWNTDTVDCILPGATALNPTTITLKGLTSQQQAWREGISRAAANRDQRRSITFTTGTEGLLPRYNDLINITHDVPGWGYSGRIKGAEIDEDGNRTGIFDLTEKPVFTEGVNHVIAIRAKDGSQQGPYNCVLAPSGDPFKILIEASQDILNAIYISRGISEEYSQYAFGPTERAFIQCVMQQVNPAKDGSVGMTLVNYADSVHTAEQGGTVPVPNPVSNLPQTPVLPIIDSVTVQLTTVVGQQWIVATSARGALYYEFEASFDNISWADLGQSAQPKFLANLANGTWWVRVRGIGAQLNGPWTTAMVVIDGSTLRIPELDLLTASTDEVFQISLAWVLEANTGGIAASVEIWEGLTNVLGDASKLVNMPLPAANYVRTNIQQPDESRYYWARVIDTAGRIGDWYNHQIPVVGRTSADATAYLAYFDGLINETQLAADLLAKIDAAADSDDIYAAIDDLDTKTTNAEEALASRTTTLEGDYDGLSAIVQINSTAISSVTGAVNAEYNVKVQAISDGRVSVAGFGIGVDNSSGVLQSQFLVMADRFAVGNGTDAGSYVSAFVVAAGVTYINSAIIQNASISMLKISGDLYSSNYVYNTSGWILTQAGDFNLNNVIGGYGRMQITSAAINIYDLNGTLRVRMGMF